MRARNRQTARRRVPECLPAATNVALFQQEKFADAVLSISTRGVGADGSSKAVRSQFPVHQAVLCTNSEYFDAQATNWQSLQQDSRPQLSMTVEPGQMEAAVAFIKAMYDPGSLFEASHEQLVQILLFAEELGAPVTVSNAVQLLEAAGSSLEPAAATQLVQHPLWPDSFMPLATVLLQKVVQLLPDGSDGLAGSYQRWLSMLCEQNTDSPSSPWDIYDGNCALFRVFGDLDAVWRDMQLTAGLLHLPLPAVKLLLEHELLRAKSEDTVFYTAMQYSKQPQHAGNAEGVLQQLLQLVRYPYLSPLCLTAAAGPAAVEVGAVPAQAILHLMQLHQTGLKARQISEAMEPTIFEQCPGSWDAPGRHGSYINPQASLPVKVTWQLPFAQLREVCSSQQDLHGPGSPPLFGMAWHARTNGSVLSIDGGVSPQPLFEGSFRLRVLGQAGRELYEQAFDANTCVRDRITQRAVRGMFAVQGSEGAAGAKVVVPAAGEGSFSIELEVRSNVPQQGRAHVLVTDSDDEGYNAIFSEEPDSDEDDDDEL